MSLDKELRNIDCDIDELRDLKKILSSSRFREMYLRTADTSEIDAIIAGRKVNRLHVWIRDNTRLDERTVVELRQLARQLNVVNWNNLPKDELVCRIQKKQSNNFTPQ